MWPIHRFWRLELWEVISLPAKSDTQFYHSMDNLWFYSVLVVQSLSHVHLCVTACTVALQASLSFTISQCLLRLMSIESAIPSNHFLFCCHLLLLPTVFPRIRVFSSKLALSIRWPKYWSFSPTDSQESPPAPFQKHQFFDFLHGPTHVHTWLLGKP